MKPSQKKKNETDRTKSDAIIARILAKGGWENPLGLPGWHWFQFPTNLDMPNANLNWYVNNDGKIKCGICFREAEEVKQKIEGNI